MNFKPEKSNYPLYNNSKLYYQAHIEFTNCVYCCINNSFKYMLVEFENLDKKIFDNIINDLILDEKTLFAWYIFDTDYHFYSNWIFFKNRKITKSYLLFGFRNDDSTKRPYNRLIFKLLLKHRNTKLLFTDGSDVIKFGYFFNNIIKNSQVENEILYFCDYAFFITYFNKITPYSQDYDFETWKQTFLKNWIYFENSGNKDFSLDENYIYLDKDDNYIRYINTNNTEDSLKKRLNFLKLLKLKKYE